MLSGAATGTAGQKIAVYGGRDENALAGGGRNLKDRVRDAAALCFVQKQILACTRLNFKEAVARQHGDLIRIAARAVDQIAALNPLAGGGGDGEFLACLNGADLKIALERHAVVQSVFRGREGQLVGTDDARVRYEQRTRDLFGKLRLERACLAAGQNAQTVKTVLHAAGIQCVNGGILALCAEGADKRTAVLIRYV